MKKIILVLIVLVVMACSSTTLPAVNTPSAGDIQTAIVQTQTALPSSTKIPTVSYTSTNTITPSPSSTITPTPTETVPPTITSTPTISPTPTKSPTPTISPTPTATLPPINAAACIPQGTERTVARVTRVIDGDTIEVTFNGHTYRVRYIGMNTPEDTTKKEYFGSQATAKNKQLVQGKTVLLVKDVSETDQYDRLLRYVLVGDLFVNYELVYQGFAHVSTYPPDVACQNTYLDAERYARSNQLGLWAPIPTPRPTSPPAIVPTAGSSGNCDPSYPTVCIPPPPPDLDCKDIPYRRFKVLPPDPHRFDGDHDGIGCES